MSQSEQGGRGPDYGIAKILRGFPNFEDYYQGLSRQIPIALSPYGSTTLGRDLDALSNYTALQGQLAAQAGATPGEAANSAAVDGITSPELMQGLPCTLGANMVFLVPRPVLSNEDLTYKIIWRMRTVDGYEKTQIPYHSTLGGARFTDQQINTSAGWKAGSPVYEGKAAQRACYASVEETIRFTEPTGTGDLRPLGLQRARDVGLQPAVEFGYSANFTSPSGGVAAWTQGPILPYVGGNSEINPTTGKSYVFGEYGQNPLSIVSPAVGGDYAIQAALFRTGVSHVSYTTAAKGDECIVLIYPRYDGDGTYNFDGFQDFVVSAYFGRGGYEEGAGEGPVFPNGNPFGVYVIGGY